MSNKKKVAKGKGGKSADDDEDWDSILAAEIQANEAAKPVAVVAPVVEKKAAEAADEDDDEDDDDEADGAAGAKKVGYLLQLCHH